MCDDYTQGDAEAALARKGLSRRDFAAMGTAASFMAWSGAGAATQAAALTERMVSVPTPHGTCDAFFVHPAKGAHPGVVFWPDVGGLRDAKKMMARRLASAGYAVLVINPYYRDSRAPVIQSFAEWSKTETQVRINPMRAKLTPEAVASDGKAYVAWLDGQAAVDKRRKVGTQGYCMGGPFTVRTAAAVPARVGAAASFHGGGLVGDATDAPVKLLDKTQASYLFAVARNDDARSPGDKDALRAGADAAKRPAEIEVYAADHGWCVPDSPAYNQAEADRAWARLLSLYAKL